MCGILALFGVIGHHKEVRAKAVDLQRRIRHRGPDGSGTEVFERNGKFDVLCHERLIINEVSDLGKEPKFSKADSDIVYIFNGEVYNYPEIRRQFEHRYKFDGNCDCQAISTLR